MNALTMAAVIACAALGTLVVDSAADQQPLATVDTLVGTWNGQWTADGAGGEGSVGLVLARVPGSETVIGQFTFVVAGTARSVRYEGRIEGGRVEFPLIGQGRLVLEPVGAPRPGGRPRLHGDWTGGSTVLPAASGRIDLTSAS